MEFILKYLTLTVITKQRRDKRGFILTMKNFMLKYLHKCDILHSVQTKEVYEYAGSRGTAFTVAG